MIILLVIVSYASIVPRLPLLQKTCKKRKMETLYTFVIFMEKIILLLYDWNHRPIHILADL